MQFLLNDIFGIKIGHPFTGRKRIKRLFTKEYFEILALEDFEANTLVVVQKERGMKLLITGAAGFIASNLTEYMLDKGYTVVGFDNYATDLNTIFNLF